MSTEEPITYSMALFKLDDDYATFGTAEDPRSPLLQLPAERWVKLGRPGWVKITPEPTRPGVF